MIQDATGAHPIDRRQLELWSIVGDVAVFGIDA
jgi:hypothetical protein